jgi:hypothetical protein
LLPSFLILSLWIPHNPPSWSSCLHVITEGGK